MSAMSAPRTMMVPVAAHSSLTMVGRDEELAEASGVLDAAVQAASAGAAHRVVVMSGDAGVGKTRLLRALRDHALETGWQVLAGHCLDFGDSALPYLPFTEVIGRIAADHPELVDAVAAVHPALNRLRPGRRARVVGDDSTADLAHATDRGDTFVAVQALLEAAATEAPVLLVVEDLHWADQSTRDMLGFLFTRPFAQPVAIIASYRSDDLHRRHPLRRAVAEWSRVPQVARLSLGPLPEEAVRALVAELADLDERSVARIVARAEGNAFFVEELVASGSCADGDVPGDLADLLLVRLDRLSDDARHITRVASVAGRRVTHDLLAATADLPSDRLDAAVREAVEMNVIEVGGHLYSFRHALLGEAINDDLLPGERVRLHARYVDALVSGAARGTAAELARHARRANDLDRAVSASIEAGDEAMAVGGPDEAADHYQQALELLADPERVARLGIDHAKLVVRAANALVTGGNAVRAGQLVAAHLAQLAPDAPDIDRARLLNSHAEVLSMTETELDPVAISAEAVARAPEGESPLRAKVLATHARILGSYQRDRQDEAEQLATEALALAERLAMHDLASDIVTTLGGLRVHTAAASEQDSLRQALESAVDSAQRAGVYQAEIRGRWLLGRSHQDAGDWEQAARWFRSAMELGEQAGLIWAPFSIESRWLLGWINYILGRWDDVLSLVGAVDSQHGPPIPRGIVDTARLAVLTARGEDVIDRVRALRGLWEDEGGIAVYSAGVEIDFHAARSDAPAALEAYDAVVGVLGRIWGESFGGRIRLAASAMDAIARALPRARASERKALANRADLLLADGEAVLAAIRERNGNWGPEGRMWSDRLVAEHLRVRWLAGAEESHRPELLSAWRGVVDSTVKVGHVPEEVRVRAAYSQILRLVGETAQARDEAEQARSLAARLGAPAMVADLATDTPAARASALTGPATLTARELEILALVAEGRTNGEIGKQLFISTKTVSVHVSNILGKLGASGRTEAAAIARRDGLLP